MQIPSSFKIRLNWINICFKCLVRWKDLATSTVTDSFAFFLRLWNFILSKTYLVIYLHKQRKKKTIHIWILLVSQEKENQESLWCALFCYLHSRNCPESVFTYYSWRNINILSVNLAALFHYLSIITHLPRGKSTPQKLLSYPIAKTMMIWKSCSHFFFFLSVKIKQNKTTQSKTSCYTNRRLNCLK